MAFVDEKKLSIYESIDLPDVPYTAISYPWRGNETIIDDPTSPFYWKDELGTFQVKGSEDGDPISLDVLYHICVLSLSYERPTAGSAWYIPLGTPSRFLWLDRLCIMQTNREDKTWQIRNMYNVYKSCELCCVVSGGLRRLVRLDEETSWIHRAWTLQEAIVPKRVTVLFAWDTWVEDVRNGQSDVLRVAGRGVPESIIPYKSARLDLSEFLETKLQRSISFSSNAIFQSMECSTISWAIPYATLLDIIGIPITPMDIPFMGHQLQLLWRSALMRTSSRPVDMIFSIMGMFGVSLDPGSFRKDDRLGATVALAREILKKGGEASWIGAAYWLNPCPQLSTFPQFPETNVAGKAYIRLSDGSLKEVVDVMCENRRYISHLDTTPDASMDDEGYLTISTHAARIHQLQDRGGSDGITISWPAVKAADSSIWRIDDATTTSSNPPFQMSDLAEPVTYMVYIGAERKAQSTIFTSIGPGIPRGKLKGWIIQQHGPDKFHRVGHLDMESSDSDLIKSYPKMKLSIGGPFPFPLTGGD